ncbi:hypothetical protein [Scytonema hofmannii]|uniref:hypothetical protein n=1 Tax=Scytonema hofmannii TaxID=34078 RepID=UPI00034C4C32|nr:hypothetical protein [Scytonema hofmannii]
MKITPSKVGAGFGIIASFTAIATGQPWFLALLPLAVSIPPLLKEDSEEESD